MTVRGIREIKPCEHLIRTWVWLLLRCRFLRYFRHRHSQASPYYFEPLSYQRVGGKNLSKGQLLIFRTRDDLPNWVLSLSTLWSRLLDDVLVELFIKRFRPNDAKAPEPLTYDEPLWKRGIVSKSEVNSYVPPALIVRSVNSNDQRSFALTIAGGRCFYDIVRNYRCVKLLDPHFTILAVDQRDSK